MTSSTGGAGANTSQTQICHQRKYLEGTYAARMRFTDAPVAGTDGDQVVQSFYTISPLKAPWDLDYSELDFEYLPNGGWGIEGPTLYGTTWETFYPEPNWKKDNVFDTVRTSQDGWHTLPILQGAEMGRPSTIGLEVEIGNAELKGARIAGKAVKVSEGVLFC